jgi:pilus assembly protein Flp/PilA
LIIFDFSNNVNFRVGGDFGEDFMEYYLENGQGLIEYTLILVLLVIVVIIALGILGPSIGGAFSNISTELSNLPL